MQADRAETTKDQVIASPSREKGAEESSFKSKDEPDKTKLQDKENLVSPEPKSKVEGEQEPQEEVSTSHLSHTLLYCCLAAFVLVVAVVAGLLCQAEVRFQEQSLLTAQQKAEYAWVETTLESVRSWHAKTLDGVRQVSQAEMFRLFVKDYQEALLANKANREPNLSAPRGENLDNMAEERAYLTDLLRDTVRRRGWRGALLLGAKGELLLSAFPGAEQRPPKWLNLLGEASKSKASIASPLYAEGDLLYLDFLDPLFEVMGTGEEKIVG
ncbi:MAG: hypothetical protein IJS50_02545, partial [Desulfovibrio sp.]|nr:hypothetical protein [Desulfovibrio sp.]